MLNVLSDNFAQSDSSGMTVVFRVPPVLLSNARPPVSLNFGDATPPVQSDATGEITHVYTAPAIVTATLADADGDPCGRARFEVPRATYGPWSIGAAAAY